MISSNENSIPLRVALGARLAVEPNLDVQGLGISEFVRRDDPGPERVRAVKALALGGAKASLHFDPLAIARGKVVEDRVAEYMRARLFGRNVRAGAARHDADRRLGLMLRGPQDCPRRCTRPCQP